MAYRLDEFYALLPALHRLRDYEQGKTNQTRLAPDHPLLDPGDHGPLKSLLSVLLREGQILREDIEALYDDNFIETCAPWVIPYIGDLVGASEMEDIGDAQSDRARIATTLALRRAKGTLAALEYATRGATGWPVRAVEYWSRMATTESMARVRMNPGGTANLRDPVAHSKVNTAGDVTPRSAEFGQIEGGYGRWNLPNIGLHLYPFEATAHGTPSAGYVGESVQPDPVQPEYYRFSTLGLDEPLFQRPEVQDVSLTSRADEADMPMQITRWMLDEDPSRFTTDGAMMAQKSFAIHMRFGGDIIAVPPALIKAATLQDFPDAPGKWQHAPHPNKLLVDPELGRFSLPETGPFHDPDEVFVFWHRGRAHAIGGHERSAALVPAADPDGSIVFPRTETLKVDDLGNLFTDPDKLAVTSAPGDPIVEIRLGKNIRRLVADEGAFPTIDCGQRKVIIKTQQDEIVLSGLRFKDVRPLMIVGSKITPAVKIEDCTLLALGRDSGGVPSKQNYSALKLSDGQGMQLSRCISDPIAMAADGELTIQDSLVLAAGPSFSAVYEDETGNVLNLLRSTIVGRIIATEVGGGPRMDVPPLDINPEPDPGIAGIQNSLIIAERANQASPPVKIGRLDRGCVRYSYVPEEARVPRRFACVTVEPMPRFTSLRLGQPGFMHLSFDTDKRIFSGADDGQEMGVGNRLRSTARLNNLARVRREYMRFGYAAGAIFDIWENET
ncbi:hypothetical protein ATO10_02955 [Actibacterium atlanticum]|uniref:Uncharacterized protein n=1 Tax=Actibacterium atlanticum TaxID=1461693 RepID=A0A058ZR38_9RHOB|nr:phage tail protein [Actibacterium atlanticum]KCV83685.1 hypothetical protein ATO10_02955 [Actibacterium atlanticum]